MAKLVSDVLSVARTILQDDAGTRYIDSQMIGFINDGINDARSLRPDLFVYTYGTPLVELSATTDPLPIPRQFFTALCYYVAGRCELRDDEFAVDGRAAMMLKALSQKLVQGM